MFTPKVRKAAIVAGSIGLGIAAVFILYFSLTYNRSDHFLPGVTIAGVNVSGYTQGKAIDAVQHRLNEAYAAQVAFYHNDYACNTTMGEIAKPINVRAKVADIWKQEKHRNWKNKIFNLHGSREISYPINIQYDRTRESKLVQAWVSKLQVEPVNASLEMDKNSGLIVVPSRMGEIVNQSSTLNKLPERWQDVIKDVRIAIVLEKRQPAVDEEALSNMGQLSVFSTWYNMGEVDRSHNLAQAASKINTAVVLPRQTFSFNRTVGERIVKNGYRDAMVIVNGKFVPGLGGGICQVSSTLYNACLLAGMKITERHNHSLAVTYVPLGLDATVAYGVQDFKFENNTSSPIYIKAIASGGKLTITLYGNLDYKQKISLSKVIDKEINYTTVYQNDNSLPAGTQKIDHKGIPGYIVRSFRTYYDSNGKVAKTEQLARDSYIPLNQIIFTGPPVAETPPAGEVQQPVETPPEEEPQPVPEEPVPPVENNETVL